jgi:hypothetical protein
MFFDSDNANITLCIYFKSSGNICGGGKLECLVTCPLHQSYSLCPSETTHFEEICAAHYMICSLLEHIGLKKKMCASRSASNYAKLLQKPTPR